MDTSVFIYHVEESEKYFPLTDPIFSWVEGPRAAAVTFTITLLEVLVQPYRLGELDRLNKFYALLSTFPHLEWVPPDLQIADVAARLRADHKLRTPDAIQAATALRSGATGFVSNDAVFQKIAGLEVLVLDDLLE